MHHLSEVAFKGIIKKGSGVLLNYIIKFISFINKLWFNLNKVIQLLSNVLISFFSIVIAVCLLLPSSQHFLSLYKNWDTIFIAIGGTLVTILILTFSLSVIPIQRAVESFSPSISKIYRNDAFNKIIYITIALFALLSFVMNFISAIFDLNASILFPYNLIFIGVSLDLLQFHHRRISLLLDPNTAIKKQLKLVFKYIDRTQKRITISSKLFYYLSPYVDKTGIKPVDLESVFYRNNILYERNIINQIGEFAEIATKSLFKNEINTLRIVVSAMTDACIHFINSRKRNISMYSSPSSFYLLKQSDIDTSLDKIYQHYLFIATSAIERNDQGATILILEAFSDIAKYLANIKIDGKLNQLNDMIFSPLFYLENIIKTAQSHNLDEVVLKGCYYVEDFSNQLPKDTSYSDDALNNPKFYYEIILSYFISNQFILINKILETQFGPFLISLERNHYRLKYKLKMALDYIKTLFPLALVCEKKNQSDLLYLPFSMPYQITNEKSLTYFIQKSTILNQVDKKRKFVSPYHYFSEYNGVIAHHFRSIADSNDIGNSGFLWHISNSIKSIIHLHFSIIENSQTDVFNHIEDLVKNITLYLSFFWSALHKSKSIKYYYASYICEIISWVGLYCHTDKINQNVCFQILQPRITTMCVSNIVDVINSYFRTGEDKNYYNFADLLMNLWYIRIISHISNDVNLIDIIDSKIVELDLFHDEDWPSIKEALVLRHNQLTEELFSYSTSDYSPPGESKHILRSIISEKEFLEQQSPICIEN